MHLSKPRAGLREAGTQMKIVAIANQKGGVGKTTTAVNLCACLAEIGKRVLLIDLDPQGNATTFLGFDLDDDVNLYQPLVEDTPVLDQIRETGRDNFYLIPSALQLAGVEVVLAERGKHHERLPEVLEPLRQLEQIDYAIIDSPPSLGILMTSALAAADDLLVPVQCEFFGIQALAGFYQKVLSTMKNAGLSRARLEGIVMTMYDGRTRLARSVIEEVRAHFPKETYKTIIPRTVRLGEAPSHRQTIIEYDSAGVGAFAYRALADEFIQRRREYKVT